MSARAVVGSMTAFRSLVIVLMALALAATAAGASAAQKPQAREDADKIVLENEHVRVWFQGKKPMLKVFPANGSNESAYEYHFTDLVEYRDVDGDGGPSSQEVVASLNLNKASAWNVTREEGDGNVTLNLTMTAPVKLGRGVELPQNASVPGGADATVSLVFRIFEEDVTLPGNVTVSRASVKYDLVVAQWPFVNAEVNRLALESLVTGLVELEEGNAATVSGNDTQLGALTWIANATGVSAEGQAVDVPVRATVAMEAGNMSRFVFTYDAPGLRSLVHDPTIGLTDAEGEQTSTQGEDQSRVPAPGVALVALVAAGAALVMRRK
jgi:hypothetical protein